MSNAFLTMESRLYAILCDGRGADGTLGPDALAKSIPAGRFRRAKDSSPLGDPTYPPDLFDRAVRVEWLADADEPSPNNPMDDPQHRLASVAISHGVLYGTALAAFLALTGAEVASTVVLQPKPRALNDAMRAQRALACPSLLRGGTALDPQPLACVREGATTLEDLGEGRMLAVTNYSLLYVSDNAQAYDP